MCGYIIKYKLYYLIGVSKNQGRISRFTDILDLDCLMKKNYIFYENIRYIQTYFREIVGLAPDQAIKQIS